MVIAEDSPPLLGRNWLKHICLNWKRIGAVSTDHTANLNLESLLSVRKELFQNELGIIQPFKAKLHVKPDAKSKFRRAHPVPFAIKSAIDQELE